MHVAILDEELPYPLTSGKRIRTYNLVRRLADRHRLTYVCHRNADAAEARLASDHFTEIGIEPVVVDRAVPPKSGPGFYARLAANLLSPLPYSVTTHASRELLAAARALAARTQVDLWQCEWTPYAQTMRGLGGANWIVVAHNVESLIWQRYAETESNPAKRWYVRRQWRKFERFERWAYSAAARVVAVSPDDARLMRDRFGAQRVAVVDNGVDPSFFRPSEGPRDPFRVLFLGSLDWRPNQDAVRLLLDDIFPVVREREPRAILDVVGRNPPDWLREASARSGVELHGSVPDVRPFVARAGVLAVPLRIGGGSRLKILEALASGLPVISTRIGAEGLDLEAGRHLTIADGPGPFADAVLAAMHNPTSAQAQADTGRQRVLVRYDWDHLADRLDEVWLSCVGLASAAVA